MAERRNPWEEVQAAHPGVPFVRMINVDEGTQAFVQLAQDPRDPFRFPPAGATVYMPSGKGGLPAGIDIAEARDLSRYFNTQPYAVRLREPEPA